MMQMPAHISLLSELFSPSNSTGNEVYQAHKMIPTGTRPELARPSFALRPASSTNPRAVHYQQDSHQPLSLHPRQQQQQQPAQRRMARRRSPSQKILSSGASRPREERDCDENGNPQLPSSGSVPATCFSYRTMEKEYELDTLRMLERIEKSRSFERSTSHGHEHEEPRSASFSNLQDISNEYDCDANVNVHGSDFYIGDDEDFQGVDESFSLAPEENLYIDEEPPVFEEEEEIFEIDL